MHRDVYFKIGPAAPLVSNGIIRPAGLLLENVLFFKIGPAALLNGYRHSFEEG